MVGMTAQYSTNLPSKELGRAGYFPQVRQLFNLVSEIYHSQIGWNGTMKHVRIQMIRTATVCLIRPLYPMAW